VAPSCARWTGIARANARSGRIGQIRHSAAIARKRGARGKIAVNNAGSMNPPGWFATIRVG
jgi:hypothetical protein